MIVVRVKCTGRVDVKHILEAIRQGADGVMVVGCHPGECDFGDGNMKARQRVEFAKKVLDKVGLGGDRVNMYNVSAAEIGRFRDAIMDMIEKLKKIGPNPLRG